MRIGIDFDNTIVNYDVLFHKVALKQGLIHRDLPVNKLAVRDHLRAVGREDAWTELQGYVYGACMDEAPAYDGAIEFTQRASALGHELFIVSHKTRFPYLGRRYDLHASARSWIEHHFSEDHEVRLPEDHVFFEVTKAEKIERIIQCECDAFIDDLPEILLDRGFPARTSRLLFDPEQRHADAGASGLTPFRDWHGLDAYVNSRECSPR